MVCVCHRCTLKHGNKKNPINFLCTPYGMFKLNCSTKTFAHVIMESVFVGVMRWMVPLERAGTCSRLRKLMTSCCTPSLTSSPCLRLTCSTMGVCTCPSPSVWLTSCRSSSPPSSPPSSPTSPHPPPTLRWSRTPSHRPAGSAASALPQPPAPASSSTSGERMRNSGRSKDSQRDSPLSSKSHR